MDREQTQRQLQRLQIAHEVILEIAQRIQERRDMGYMEDGDETQLAAYRRVLADLAIGIEVGKDELANT